MSGELPVANNRASTATWRTIIAFVAARIARRSCIDAGLECTAATRNSYADFLNCREDFQDPCGVRRRVARGGKCGGDSVGVSALAGTALGATAAGGAGLDYIAYSPAKTQAYANATAQLQCVLYDSSTLTNVLPELYDSFAKLQAALLQPSPPLPCPLDSIISLPQQCTGVRKDDLTLYNDLLAEDAIALQQACAAQTSFSRIGRDIFATTRNIDVRTFAAAKNGIPTPTTIQTAMQTASTLPGSSGSSSAASSKVQPASASNPTFQLQGFGKSNPFRSNSTPTATPTCDLESAQAAAARFRQILRQAQLPQPGFPDCMALSASTPSASSSPSAGRLHRVRVAVAGAAERKFRRRWAKCNCRAKACRGSIPGSARGRAVHRRWPGLAHGNRPGAGNEVRW